ncbi:uncharacterized protein [Choristoneura fumiferana]|uniref:uncharacterized protein n=1 Tax=Choristoneura fumiferana TaxID=7141 RepID=UPI003D15AFC4
MATRRRWYRARRGVITLSCSSAFLAIYLFFGPDPDRVAVLFNMEIKLEEALKLEKELGCEIPDLDPFAPEVTMFDKNLPKIKCFGTDWVKCYHSSCKVVDGIMETVNDIKCSYRDILYQTEENFTLGPVILSEDDGYELTASDHAEVSCNGIRMSDDKKLEWSGHVVGFRSTVKFSPPQPGREVPFNVMILAFDTMSRNEFIRRMTKSWKAITEELGATVMEGYNIVGDGTLASLFPILTGNSELELSDTHKRNHGENLDSYPFIFYKLQENGYRTAFFEDRPNTGTFQFNGFRRQPTDHYLRAFSMADAAKNRSRQYCVGDTPQFRLMINVTEQFMELEGKRFIFTLISDITEDRTQDMDEDTAAMLRRFYHHGDDTLLVLLGAHGPRFPDTLHGKLEERLPLLALRLPTKLTDGRPDAITALRDNARVLTTPHDLHATILDVLGLKKHANPFKEQESDLYRGLTMLEWLPGNRSCHQAGIQPHLCACFSWQTVPFTDPLCYKASRALLKFINTLLAEVGSRCVPRTLLSTEWLFRRRTNSHLLSFPRAADENSFYMQLNADAAVHTENYKIRIIVGPGLAVFEASLTYALKEDRFYIRTSDISRSNTYGDEPDCIRDTHPHLSYYCYCRR